MTPPDSAARTADTPLLIGHRGSPRTHPENSLEGMLHALEVGCDGVEFDIRLAGDGVPVVAHDANLKRTHGEDVDVDHLPADLLPLPTLTQLLEALSPYNTRLLDIELKVPVPVATLEACFDTVDWPGPRVVTSFLTQVVDLYAEAGWRSGLLLNDRNLRVSETEYAIDSTQADVIGLRRTLFLNRFVPYAAERGKDVWVWTLNRRIQMQSARRRGVAAIITDYPNKGMEMVHGRRAHIA